MKDFEKKKLEEINEELNIAYKRAQELQNTPIVENRAIALTHHIYQAMSAISSLLKGRPTENVHSK